MTLAGTCFKNMTASVCGFVDVRKEFLTLVQMMLWQISPSMCRCCVNTFEQYARGSHQPVTSNVQSNTANTNHNLKTSIGETTDFDARRGARVVGRRNGVVLQ